MSYIKKKYAIEDIINGNDVADSEVEVDENNDVLNDDMPEEVPTDDSSIDKTINP